MREVDWWTGQASQVRNTGWSNPKAICAPIVTLPDVLLDALDELAELPVNLVAPLSFALLLFDFVRVVPAINNWRVSILQAGEHKYTGIIVSEVAPTFLKAHIF